MTPAVRLMRLAGADPGVPLPAYATDGAAGADLRANLEEGTRGGGMTLAPMARALVPTGLAVEVPPGWEAQLRPRSGLALRAGLTLLNTPATIDSDYRGELCVLMVNLGDSPVHIAHGARIAQMVIAPAPQARFQPVPALSASERAEGGFGSTGEA